ncbi:DUF3313 domain-containing protein, partial [uncultured Nitrospira sp.]|uniref:DUF3313 domain-containing protein n=1 Tax=uncultured Nitrospira sp. TaxID=157176 RepID=UPI00314046DD
MKKHVTRPTLNQTSHVGGEERELHIQRNLRFAQWGLMVSILIMVAGGAGCAQTEQAREVETSGFLGDYSILQPGKEGEALLVYKNPQADFSMYRAVYVEPAVVLLSKKSTVPQEELHRLADDLRSKVIWKLKEDFLVVPKLVPGALQIELALTEAEPSDVGMDIVSTILPPATIVSEAKELATGTQAFVGRVSIEAKLTDGNTGTLLMAAADRRVGARSLDGSMDSWDDVHQAFAYWADTLAHRLREWRKTPNP